MAPGSPPTDKGASPQPVPTATPHLPIPKLLPSVVRNGSSKPSWTSISPTTPNSAPYGPYWYTKNFLMQTMSPAAPNSAVCRKPIGAYWRKTWCPVAAVKWDVFVPPPPP